MVGISCILFKNKLEKSDLMVKKRGVLHFKTVLMKLIIETNIPKHSSSPSPIFYPCNMQLLYL